MQTVKKFAGAAIAAMFGIIAAIIYTSTKAAYPFPSADDASGARLEVLWKGLDTTKDRVYPLMETVTKWLGVGNGAAVLYGVVAVVLLYLLVAAFIKTRFDEAVGDNGDARLCSRVGGAVAAAVFMFSPAVHEAATHLEPRMFALVWAMLATLVLRPLAAGPKWQDPLLAAFAGWMVAAGLCDSPLFLALLPFWITVLTLTMLRAGRSVSLSLGSFALVFVTSFLIRAARVSSEMAPYLRTVKDAFVNYFSPEGWLFVAVFATLPFIVAVAAGRTSFYRSAGATHWLAHVALTFVTLIGIATPAAPSSVMAKYAILPVAPCAYAAFAAGYLAAFWLQKTRSPLQVSETSRNALLPRISKPLAMTMLGLLGIVLAVSAILNFCSFDTKRGAFASKIAEKTLDALDGRTWLVTDGALDDQLMLAAERRGVKLHIVSLVREKDKDYIARLAQTVKDEKIGGAKNGELVVWLNTLGVLTFVQRWFEAAPDEARALAAVWGYSDFAPNVDFVPEKLFFGARKDAPIDWKAQWEELSEILYAPKDWGSYKLYEVENPTDRERLNLRRHVGMIATDYGVMLHDKGEAGKAFEMYELVLNEIDSDNICALMNELDLASAGLPAAKAKQRALQGRIESIVKDTKRRYDPRMLPLYYGQVRNPQMFSLIGLALAKSGRTGEALKNLSRAINLLDPAARSGMMSTMAALYADSADTARSREIYESILEKDPQNHEALSGLVRISLMDGDTKKAISLLEVIDHLSGDDPRANSERAMLKALNGDFEGAKKFVRKQTDANPADLHAWSFLANIIAQQHDSAQSPKERAALLRELEEAVLPSMEKAASDPGDFNVQTARALLFLRKGDSEENRRNARDAYIAAAISNPRSADAARTSDIILSLDISLNDTEDAERQAIATLRRNPGSSLANYVMGSLALQRGDYVQAEAFLRRSADAPKPSPLAMNDLAEVLRRADRLEEAENYARRAVAAAPGLYVVWDTLGAIILARGGDLAEAESCANKACALSKTEDGKEADVRMLITLARVQLAKGDKLRAKGTLRKVQARLDELSDYERAEFEEMRRK